MTAFADLSPDRRDQLRDAILAEKARRAGIRDDAEACEQSLVRFLQGAWPQIESGAFQDGWAIDALAEHLEAVAKSDINRLLVNFPPRMTKTTLCSICFPAWVWARRQISHTSGPGVHFLCASYGHTLSLENANKARRLILSPWYQARWGDRFKLRADQNAKSQYDTDKGGSRIATSVGGALMGIGGDVVVVDDPHNLEGAESETERETTLQWWREVRSTRLNDPKQSALVVVMQRLNENDVSGQIIEGDDYPEWTHLMLPMRYDARRHCVSVLSWTDDGYPNKQWEDPRTKDGELLWPERFGERETVNMEHDLGSYMASGRLQQQPSPKGGGIFKSEWWRLYPPQGEKLDPRTQQPLVPLEMPQFSYILAYVDTALTTKEENDWSACTVWGVWNDADGTPKLMLKDAWKDHLEFKPLQERITKTALDNKVDTVVIEAKANGISVAQELSRVMRKGEFGVRLDNPEGDKVARAYSISHLLEGGLVYAPDRKYATMVIDDCALFPKGTFDDIVDTVTGALRYLRKMGLAQLASEYHDDQAFRLGPSRQSEPLYPV